MRSGRGRIYKIDGYGEMKLSTTDFSSSTVRCSLFDADRELLRENVLLRTEIRIATKIFEEWEEH